MRPSPTEYGPGYYGTPGWKPVANYTDYSPRRMPSWVEPLSAWLLREAGPYLDVGAAFGHLAGVLESSAHRFGGMPKAVAVEWSDFATLNALCPYTIRADGRYLPITGGTFPTIISLDFLEHFEPEETAWVMGELRRIHRRPGIQVHLIGHGEEATHYQDPTHRNHEPMDWYLEQAIYLDYRIDERRTQELNRLRGLSDWAGRWLVMEG